LSCWQPQGEPVHKTVFIIFFQGEQLKIRVKKICEGFRATLYPCPDTPADRREMAMGVMTRIEDLNTVSTCVKITSIVTAFLQFSLESTNEMRTVLCSLSVSVE
jgi:vacuolar-type H+-ATPase subunit I/STV1